MPSIADLVLPCYYGALGVLAFYGVHRLALLVLLRRHRKPSPRTAWSGPLPRVTVQLPLYNERYVALRLLAAVCRLDYPRELLDIQVLDDSTDDTTELLELEVDHWSRSGYQVQLLHRDRREGFKAGALEAGLATAKGELIAIFDADFVPPRHFLRSVVPSLADRRVGMVQARWEYLNRDHSMLTRLQALLLDGHFVIEHTARAVSGRLFNFNGTAGIWRRTAIEEAGGWQHDTLTEDLDISYRSQLAGWKFVYLPELTVPSELPVDIAAFKSQQYRWARGSIQTARKLLGRIAASSEPWWRKLEAFVHLTNNSSFALTVLLSLLIFPAMLARDGADQWLLIAIDLPLFLVSTVSVAAYYVTGQRHTASGEKRPFLMLPAALALGIGLSINNTRAVLAGIVKQGGVFVRTPKYPVEAGSGAPPSAYLARINSSFLIEGLFAVYFFVCLLTAASLEMWFSLPFLYLFFQGYGYMFALSIAALWRRSKPTTTSLARAETTA